RRPIMQPGKPFGCEPVQPGLHTLARYTHRRRDLGLSPAGAVPLHNQHTAMECRAGTTVRHENLRADVGLRQATPHSGVLTPFKPPRPLPTSWAGRPSVSVDSCLCSKTPWLDLG